MRLRRVPLCQMAPVALLIGAALPCSRAQPFRTVEVQHMQGDTPAWEGPVTVDTTVTHAGAASFRWAPADGSPITLPRPMPEAGDLNMLSLWVHSERMTAAWAYLTYCPLETRPTWIPLTSFAIVSGSLRLKL